MTILKNKKESYLKWFLFFSFTLAASNAFIAYIQSSYLSRFMDERLIGLVFVFAYILSFLAVNNFTAIINRLKIFLTGVLVLAALILGLLIMGFATGIIAAILATALYTVFLNLIWILLDIYLERFSQDESTGRIRGMYWTAGNAAWLLSPLLTGWILSYFDYSFLFILSALLALLILICFIFRFGKLQADHFPKPHFFKTIKRLGKDKLLKDIFVVSFILQFFYSIMLIYTPIYLHAHIGLSWTQIGIIFTVMLVNFVVMTYPAGYLADKRWGEKEMIIVGLGIMGVSTLILGLGSSTNFWFWLVVLFFTRVGASLVDIMRDSYFFKRVAAKDIEVISLFRNTSPLAYIAAPIFASLLLFSGSYRPIFILTGLIVISGIYFASRLKDTL